MILLSTIVAQGQIKIGGNVYGGGNKGNVNGNATVRVRAGEINKVFGGARTANVGGRTFVNIDGEHALDDVVISEVYGGNDVAGTIGQSGVATTVPEELTNVVPEPTSSQLSESGKTREAWRADIKTDNPKKNLVDNTWKTFVATSRSKKVVDKNTVEDKWITIGTVFGGGNGDFIYTNEDGTPQKDASDNYLVTEKKTIDGVETTITVATSPDPFTLPNLDKTYLEIKGGNIAHVYGGGNNVTVRENTTINIDNTSEVCQGFVATYMTKTGKTADETIAWLKEMSGLRTFQSDITSFEFNHARIFGGNNKAAMAIHPTWNLQQGIIRDLYSGGNQGDMNSSDGLLLEIDPVEKDNLAIHNVFGGCRMADVKPLDEKGEYTPCQNPEGYFFPKELSARVLVRGGIIDNVYGGNDITGTVYGGNAIGIYSSINGDVYGGGNGAYAYSNLLSSKKHADYADFYFDTEGSSPVAALNAHRPNAEQVSIRLAGTDAAHPTIIKGSVFVGGNCASLATKKGNPMVELKIGSHVIADKVFLGNNGEKMVDPTILGLYKNEEFSSLDLTQASTFSDYMLGAAMDLQPAVVFDNVDNDDRENYIPYSSYVGSFYCGGNRGSMIIPGKNIYEIDKGLYIFDKFVGGCNNAYVDEQWTGENKTGTQLCAAYEGGILGSDEEMLGYTDASGNIKDRLEINLKNMTIMPLRWIDDTKTGLKWNTQKWNDETNKFENVDRNPSDNDIRLGGGNVYGGCYESGHVNGNVVININDNVMKKDEVFIAKDKVYDPSDRTSGVQLDNQRNDLMAVALTVFGAGYGEDTEIWGSTTVNLNKGYAFQIFGGGELGVVGRKRDVKNEVGEVIDQEYYFNPAFSSTVNLNGASPIYSSDGTAEDLAESEYLYGGGNEGDVCGNTYVNLGNGRIYDAFGGASNANILGHTEVIIGRQPNGSGGYKLGFPWIRDIVYGGNDFGGEIKGNYEDGFDATARVQNYATVKEQLHGYAEGKHDYLLKGSSYVEYLQGRVDTIFGGSYGYYDYVTEYAGGKMPRQESAFVNLRPVSNDRNSIVGVFGAGTGYPGNREDDKAQDHSYVLVDIPHENGEGFKNMEVFGAGSYNGLGMREEMATTFAPGYDLDKVSAVVDLLHGEIGNAYGGSYREGNTCRTVVNVPAESTIKIKNIFGGAYGLRILPPCDVIQSIVNYHNTSENAVVTGAIYGGNNNQRRAIFTNVNISSPVWSDKSKGYLAKVYGAGKGFNSWSEHTNVNLLSGAKVYEVYGGGEMGHVLNAETVQKYMQNNKSKPSVNIAEEAPWNDPARWDGAVGSGTVKTTKLHEDDDHTIKEEWDQAWIDAWSLGDYYTPNETFDNYFDTFASLRNTSLVRKAEIDERDYTGYTSEEKAKRYQIYNTNVIINEGAEVVNYAYGGGYGSSASPMSGDVWGHTYIALLGGKVRKDIYAAGTAGAVDDGFAQTGAYNGDSKSENYNPYGFTASTTAYIKGGSCRNVYGGGWEGNVGLHTGDISDSPTGDKPGETYVVIGDLNGSSFTNGIPTIQRNAYGGGEGGAVYGTANIKLNKGYIGYEYKDDKYVEKIEDDTQDMPNTKLEDAGCLFGGGYIDNSTVDKTNVILNGGVVRNSVFGGGEIAAIGRGDMKAKGSGSGYELKGIYRPGKTHVEMYSGHVQRNVYGGGRGYDNLGRVGSLNSPGYIFGQTEVHVHGGEIGTAAGLAKGDGNVFGACDIGHVYSALEEEDNEGNIVFYKGVKIGERYGSDAHQGYYFKHTWADSGEGSGFIMDGGENIFTEDCKVVIEPMCQVKLPVEIDGTAYAPGEFVPIAKLNKLGNKNNDSKWTYLDDAGIVIHNAVFAGGNNPPGSTTTSANTASVFGNATASINDVYHRDLITLGTRHTGGLYGDGNLTLVDGYRELNITNYGTDYYSIKKEITIDEYHALPEREAAYYELRYTCLKDCKDKEDTQYHKAEGGSKASTITADELQTLFLKRNDKGDLESVTDGGTAILTYNSTTYEWEPNPLYWEESGVLPVYAGRLMNSIQRADFCGVFGSRMVMQGAQDRVPEEADYTNYTINRVREVSLNKKESSITEDASPFHGNYFGIYNIVNYLGALTSDVDFGGDDTSGDIRTTDNTDTKTYQAVANGKAYGTATFYDWKKEFHLERKRNNGNSHNKVALASGVYLEITTEKSTGTGLYEKDWGPITGVIELDLINVSPGIGGGFVYAKNIHGKRKKTGYVNTTLTDLNDNAVTQWNYTYDATSSESYYSHDAVDGHDKTQWQSSGNFVHSTQTIIDDCYNISNKYMNGYDAPGGVPAHYWYIKGTTYVYDQYISAYTGQPNAYSEVVEIPLTIAAASHGKMKLLEVKPNRYAYYSAPGVKLEKGKKMVINDKTYYKNDPISYWDWYLLSNAEKELFVEKTYTNCVSVCIDGGTLHEAGTLVMTDTEYAGYGTHTYTDAEGNVILDGDKEVAGKEYIFRESNNASHDTGYLLTYEVNNPSKWDTWYTPKTTSYTGKKTTAEYEKLTTVQQADYEDGPTYRLKATSGGAMLGQQTYAVGDIISQNIETIYQAVAEGNRPGGQATFQPAYIVTSKITVNEGGVDHNYYPGTTVSETFAEVHSGSVEEARICTKTVQISNDNIILKGSKIKQSEWQKLYNKYKDGTDAEKKIAAELLANVVPAYYCTAPGLYGGNYYVAGHNYRGLEAWSSMSVTDRSKFVFNYDALDLFIDPSYSKTGNQKEGQKYQYDGEDSSGKGFIEETQAKTNAAGYSLEQGIDYTATYDGSDTGTYNGVTLQNGKEYSREDFEKLPNEQRHYAPIAVTDPGTYYVVNTAFQVGATPYAIGSTISSDTYNSLPDKDEVVTKLTIDASDIAESNTYYYCREDYTGTVDVTAVTSSDIPGAGGGVSGKDVQKGTLITKSQYSSLPNKQTNFTIHGISPTETSTLYVSRESDIYNLSKEKIITVVYQYDYEETDGTGNVTPVSERHVLNIHLEFKSGVPVVEDIEKPDLILPGWFNTMRKPDVTPGAYEVTGGGWELFESKSDAERHTNGVEYDPSTDPLYWYQDGHYVAYYAKTYLGRTYSNAVPVSVANYHDLADVMSDANKEHHMYIDNSGVKREPKIYINDYSESGKNGLDLFKQLYDLSIGTSLEGHAPLNTSQVGSCKNLEFFMRTDIDHGPTIEPNPAHETDPSAPETITVNHPWTSIGTDAAHCFDGILHGDGHTISGLNNSLFNDLCGEVYNLGVMGTFNTAGVVNTGKGYVESCWTKTTATTPLETKPNAVFGNPTDTKGYQLVNSYFWNGNKKLYRNIEGDNPAVLDYEETITSGGERGKATAKSDTAFYNGELAYDLNNFYLYKRYSDQQGLTSGVSYDYFTIGEDNKPVLHMDQYYKLNDNAIYCSTGTGTESANTRYVEDRFKDGDFRYAAGEIPESIDERHWLEIISEEGQPEKSEDRFSPIYPDDYIFFGQKLTYGWAAEAHQDVPTAVVREDGRLSTSTNANRVYRAPAYFRSKDMGMAYFNPQAYLAQKSADGTKEAYPGMTAIDFAGHQQGHEKSAYKLGMQDGWFYSPLLDDDGLTSIKNCDETQNLLVYAPAENATTGYANKATYDVLTEYFVDPEYSSYYDNSKGYRLVDVCQLPVYGHLVQNNMKAIDDHLLVDKEDFNAPLAYSFDNSHRMWYQRKPADKEFVDRNKGWMGISIPFSAELVTTNDKGEITHFYSGSETSKNGTGSKIGHEYWLREFRSVTTAVEGEPEKEVAKATFNYPTASGSTKTVTNHFLWDYYYEKTERKDKNSDIYQDYYRNDRNYTSYPLLTAAKPYIIGFPGETYYEFDLSGKFVAQNTALKIDELTKQTITFASNTGIGIAVSDDEGSDVEWTTDGTSKKYTFTFHRNYLNKSLEASDYVMNEDGSQFNKVEGAVSAVPFRPFFTASSAAKGGARRMLPERILFGGDYDGLEEEPTSMFDGSLDIYVKDHRIITTSHLKEPVTIRIRNVSGITFANYVLQPGETQETRVQNAGVYIVNKKKVLVK